MWVDRARVLALLLMVALLWWGLDSLLGMTLVVPGLSRWQSLDSGDAMALPALWLAAPPCYSRREYEGTAAPPVEPTLC